MVVERDHDLDMAGRALHSARTGTGSVVVITGPLGIGKSELLRTFACRGRRAGFRVLRATGASHEQDFEYGVVRQLFELALDSASPEVRQRWAGGAAVNADAIFANCSLWAGENSCRADEKALRGLRTFVANMSAEQPLLLLVDDLQWADAASLRWLNYLNKRMDGLPVAVAMTLLEGDPGAEVPVVREITDAAAVTLRPAPLSLGGARTLVHDVFGETGDEEFVRACLEASAGSPMFLMSTLADMQAAGRRPMATEADAARSSRPSAARERVLSCLSGQPPAVRGLLQAAAILDGDAHAGLMPLVADLDEIQYAEAVRVLRRLGLLTTQSPPRATHPVVPAAATALMTVEEWEQIHLRAALLLREHGCPAGEVAAYLVEVASPLDDWAIWLLRGAAEAELDRGAPETAARYLRRALLDSSPDGEDRAGLLVDLATAERAFDPSASVRHVCQAVPMLTCTSERAVAAVRLSPMTLASSPTAVMDLVRSVAQEVGEPEELCGAQRELALHLEARRRYLLIEDPAEVMDCVRRLKTLGPNPPLDTAAERELVTVLIYASTITGHVGAREVARLANRILEREPSTVCHVHSGLPLLANVLLAADSPEQLFSWLGRMGDHDQRYEDVVARSLVCTETALLLMAAGKPTEALVYARKAVDLGGLDWEYGSSVTLVTIASLAMETQDAKLTTMLLKDAEPREKTVCVRTALRLLRGATVTARGEISPALQQILDQGRQLERLNRRNPALCPWRSVAAAMHHRLGNTDEARELIEEEYKLAMDWGAPAAIGRALRTHATFSDNGKDIALLHEAVSVLSESANRLELARSHLLLARRLRAVGEPGAEKHLRTAREIARECGEQSLLDRANVELGAPASVTTRPSSALTPTEQRVATLARDGWTNQEIAEGIQVTLRAVEKTLTKIYRKLGIRGRAELADALCSR